MPTLYTQPGDPAKLDPQALAAALRRTVEDGFHALCRIPHPLASRPLAPGKWSPKQVVGHLIDSAANNHQRFVRLQIEPNLHLPGYRQEDWVSVQRYDLLPWMQILETWRVLNLHLVHVIQHIRQEHLTNLWHWDEGPMSLGLLVEDYIGHIEHHLRQLPVFAE